MEISVEEKLGLLGCVDLVSLSEVEIMTDRAQRQLLLDAEVADRRWSHGEFGEVDCGRNRGIGLEFNQRVISRIVGILHRQRFSWIARNLKTSVG